MMTRHQGWVCENGHRIPTRATTSCPDCGATLDLARERRVAASAGPPSARVVAERAMATITLLVAGAVSVLVLSALMGWAAASNGPEGPGLLGAAAELLQMIGFAMVAVAVIALGVRLGVRAARD